MTIEEKKEQRRIKNMLYSRRRHAELRLDPAWREANRIRSNRYFHEKMARIAATRIFVCKECQREFKPLIGRQKYCSEDCVNASRRKREGAKKRTEPEKLKRNEYLRQKRVVDPVFRFRKFVHWTVLRALTRLSESKRSKVILALPYSIPQLKAHLESQFDNQNGFTWENYGTVWEMDHIVPQSLFTFTSLDSKAFRDCWALSNLRPLACPENLKKANRI